MNLYFVATDSTSVEAEVFRELQPPKLLMSYYYFRSKGVASFVEKIGYQPEIMLDSGAYSAYTKGRNISPIDYMNFISKYETLINHYIALDVIGDAEITRFYYEIMRSKGWRPIPVFHYGDDVKYLQRYITDGNDYIALGGCAQIRDKKKVAQWCSDMIGRYPDVKFHLLGSSSRQIIDKCELYSFDSSTWIMMAINGYPKDIKGKTREAKIQRAKWQMRNLTDIYGIQEDCKK